MALNDRGDNKNNKNNKKNSFHNNNDPNHTYTIHNDDNDLDSSFFNDKKYNKFYIQDRIKKHEDKIDKITDFYYDDYLAYEDDSEREFDWNDSLYFDKIDPLCDR